MTDTGAIQADLNATIASAVNARIDAAEKAYGVNVTLDLRMPNRDRG